MRGAMQSFREQSSYGSQQTYPPEAHGASRIEEYSPRQQAQMFQGSYGGRRGATGTPTTVTPGENSSLQSYQAFRKDSGDFYYLGNKEGSTAGSQTPQRRPSGPVQNYGPPQGSNSSSGSTGFGAHYGREGHHSQFSGQHSATASISQYSQDFPGSFSPGGGQYPSHVPTQQLRQQLYQSHHSISQSANTSASTGASHLQQIQRSAAISSSVGYPLRMGQYGQHYQSSAGSSTSYSPQRFGQSGSNYEGYSPGGTSSPYESHISGSTYGTQQQGFSNYSQHLKNFEATKIPQGGNQGQQQQNPHVMQFSNSSKLLTQSQAGQFNQSDVPVRSPMQFQQNFSPISNPSPAASVVQSPGCSSTPSPLMTSGENLQCSQGSAQHSSRNRVLPMMPQLSPNTQIGNYKGFGVEGHPDKRLTDPGLSSLSALSSQVANLPNTVQHMLLSDALAPNKKGSKRTSRKTDSCANSETSSQAEEQLKSPMTESLDGSCSSSSADPGERVRQLSGQSTSSDAGYKGPPSEKPTSPVQVWQNETLEKNVDQEPSTVPEPVESFQEVPKPSEKSVGVIVSMETMTNRLEKVVEEVSKSVDVDSSESNLPKTTEDNDSSCSNNQNGESGACDPVSATTANVSQTESARSPVSAGFGIKEAPSSTQHTTNLPQSTKNSDSGNIGTQGDRKPGRNEKFPSLLQEVLQGHHQQEGRYARSAQEHPAGIGNSEVVLRSNVLTSQANEQSSRNILGKNSALHLEAPHWGQWERKSTSEAKSINLDVSSARKFEADMPASSHEQSSGPSERRSVICDISPLRQIVREPSNSHLLGTAQERPPDGRPGQSVILPSGVLNLEKSNCLSGIAKVEDEPPKMHRKRTEHCMPYSTKDSVRGSASPRSMNYDPSQDYSSHSSRASNPKRGTGRVGSRGRSSAQTQDLSDKLKMSPGRSRGPTEIPHMNPTMSISERASRDALYSAFFQTADGSALGYHTNSRSSSYGEPHPAFTSPLHYKRQMYQQEEYKEWLGSSAQAILSASQHRQEMQRKSPRQEPFHVCSPGRNENEGLGYSQPSSYHEPSNIDYSRQLRMSEGTPSNMINVEMKRNSQKTPPGDSASWHLGHQASPAKKVGSSVVTNQKSFSSNRESEPHVGRSGESMELPQQGCSVHRPTGPEEASHHNPLIMRRRVRSFISPIPSKRQFPDDKGRSSVSKDGFEKIPAAHVVSPVDADTGFSVMTEDSAKSISEQRSPTAVSLSSPTKTKILPPRKGRGLKLEAIVQKITSPNIRRITTPCTSEGSTEPVTLDDILSLKGKGPDGGNVSTQDVTERTANVLPSVPCNEEMKVKGLSPKSIDVWTVHDDKQIKKEMDEQSFESKELLQNSSIIQSSTNHYINERGDSPAFEPKCPLQTQQCELGDKDKLAGAPCPFTPKQDVIPPKGYFPSGKKKGRPVGSVNKQKKLQLQQQQQQQAQQLQEQQQALPTITGGLTSPFPASAPIPSPPPPPPAPEILPVSEPGFESEPKPKRRRRERRKAAGTTRRRRGRQAAPIVAPLEPEIKLKYASQTVDKTETKAKSFFPYIHVENKEELGLACVIINAEDEEQRWKKLTSVRKGQRSTSPQPTESKALPVSSFMVQGPVVTESASVGHLVCCFCGKWANYKNFGDLFGPFYTQEYASTLSKNPPPKKSVETPKKVKVRHKDASDGSKTDSDEEDEPEQAREQRSLPAHPRFKRRNRSGDCASSRHAVPSRRKTTDSCELNTLDSSGTSTTDGVSDQGFQIPQLPLDSNEFWMHEGCVLWANGVYLVCGRLYGLQEALDIAREMNCAYCQEPGATLGCYNKGCACCYHFPCAMDSECLLSEENFSVRCPKHKMKTLKSSSAEQPEQS